MCCVWCYWVCFPFSAQVCGAVLCGIPGKPAVHQMSSEGAFFKSYAMDVWCQSIASTSGNVFLYRLEIYTTSAKYSGFVSSPVFLPTSLSHCPLACLGLWRLCSLVWTEICLASTCGSRRPPPMSVFQLYQVSSPTLPVRIRFALSLYESPPNSVLSFPLRSPQYATHPPCTPQLCAFISPRHLTFTLPL